MDHLGVYIGASMLCVLAVVVLAVAAAFRGMFRTAQKGRRAYAKALPATARVLKIGDSVGGAAYDNVDVDLSLEVEPPAGAPYKVLTTWSVEPAALSRIRVGSTLAVRIDADHPSKIYSAEIWAQSIDAEQEPILETDD